MVFTSNVYSAQLLSKTKMTLGAVKNAEYYIKSYDRNVKLTNGIFESGSLGEDYLYVGIEKAILGDLNNDNKKDAAVILVSSGGGTGRFYELADNGCIPNFL